MLVSNPLPLTTSSQSGPSARATAQAETEAVGRSLAFIHSAGSVTITRLVEGGVKPTRRVEEPSEVHKRCGEQEPRSRKSCRRSNSRDKRSIATSESRDRWLRGMKYRIWRSGVPPLKVGTGLTARGIMPNGSLRNVCRAGISLSTRLTAARRGGVAVGNVLKGRADAERGKRNAMRGFSR